MANMYNTGINDIIKQLKALGDGADEVSEKMLTAGTKIVQEEWKKTAEKHGYRNTGEMIKSIRPTAIKRNANALSADIYPQGKDKKGVRNATKAYILHYGTSKIKASHWVDEADAAAEPRVGEAYHEIWDAYLKEKVGG